MFKNLKQRVSSDQKSLLPTSHGHSGTHQRQRLTQRTVTSRTPNPAQSHDISGENTPSSSKTGSRPAESGSNQSHHVPAKTEINGQEVSESPDVLQRVDTSAGGDAVTVEDASVEALLQKQPESYPTPTSEQKVPFFKRLEFLTPLKDQIVPKFPEQRNNLIASFEDLQGKVAGVNKGDSKPDVVAQANEQNRRESFPDAEELMQTSVDVSGIPKGQLFSKILRLEKTLLKYREKYAEIGTHLCDMKHENEKLKMVLQKSQEKNLRRITELKEASELDQKAKMHLEEEFQSSLEEKDQLIRVLQTQVAILKDDQHKPENGTESASQLAIAVDVNNKIKSLEDQLKFSKETCDGLRSQSDALQIQLNERLEELEKLKDDSLSDKSKLIKQLREAKNVIEHLEEDKQMAVAEAKRQGQDSLESKELELRNLCDNFNKMNSDNESRLQILQMNFEQQMSEKEDRLNNLQISFEQLKANNKRELESLQSTIDQITADKEREVTEKENQLKAVLGQSELSKMRVASQQDFEAQNTLLQLDKELEIVQNKVDELEKARESENQKYKKEMKKMKDEIQDLKKSHQFDLQSLMQNCESELLRKDKETQDRVVQYQLKVKALQNETEGLTSTISKLEEEVGHKNGGTITLFSDPEEAMARMKEERSKSQQEIEAASSQAMKLEWELTNLRKELERVRQNKLEIENKSKLDRDAAFEKIYGLESEKKNCERRCCKVQTELKEAEQQIGKLQAQMAEANSEICNGQDAVDELKEKLGASQNRLQEFENSLQVVQVTLATKETELNKCLGEKKQCQLSVTKYQRELESMKAILEKNDACIKGLEGSQASLTTQIRTLRDDLASSRKEIQENCVALETANAEKERVNKSLEHMKSDCFNKKKALDEAKKEFQIQLKIRLEENTRTLTEESQKRLTDLKKRAEQRLGQIKKNLSTQTEEKQNIIEQLQEKNSALEQKIKTFEQQVSKLKRLDGVESEDLRKEMEKLRHEEVKRIQDEKEDMQKTLNEKIATIETNAEAELKHCSETLDKESRMKCDRLQQEFESLRAMEAKKFSEEKEQIQRLCEEKIMEAGKRMKMESMEAIGKVPVEDDSKYQTLYEEHEKLREHEFEKLRYENEHGETSFEEKVGELVKGKEEAMSLYKELENKMEVEMKRLETEKEQITKSMEEQVDKVKKAAQEQLRQDVASVVEEERMKYEEEKMQLAEVKGRLEDVLREAKLKLEETENKMMEEKDRGELAVQEEKDRRLRAELRLSVVQEDTETAQRELLQKLDERNEKVSELEKCIENFKADMAKQEQTVSDLDSAHFNEVSALRKRNAKLEKEREDLKQERNDIAKLHEQQIWALKGEIESAQKQVDVLSNSAVSDNAAEVERKLELLREDFEKRLAIKEEKNSEKINTIVKEYETQFQKNELSMQAKMDSATQKHLALEDSLRSQHHQDLLSLQREIQSKEREMESVFEKYETEMHEMETRMSGRVDKAMYRAITAEKKVEDAGWEENNRKLQDQLVNVNQTLAMTQQREEEKATMLRSLEARVSLATPFADPEKLEYLRRVMYEYMMGNENKTMAKVLVVLLQFNELEAQQILEKHKLSSVRLQQINK